MKPTHVQTYAQRRSKHKRQKASRVSWHIPLSRRKKSRAKRKAITDSTGIIRHGGSIEVTEKQRDLINAVRSIVHNSKRHVMDLFLSLNDEGVVQLQFELQFDGTYHKIEIDPYIEQRCGTYHKIEIDPYIEQRWPDSTLIIKSYENPENIIMCDLGEMDPCECVDSCDSETCLNVLSAIFCTPDTCNMTGECGNRGSNLEGLQLRKGKNGYTVFTEYPIKAGTVIGTYWGRLTLHDLEGEHLTSGYELRLGTKSNKGKKVYIDASLCGGITRFINHSCDASSHFIERRNRREVRVLVVAQRDINANEELSVHYGDDLWFTCTCGSANCVSDE